MLGLSQSGRRSHCASCRSSEHLDVILAARELLRVALRKRPGRPRNGVAGGASSPIPIASSTWTRHEPQAAALAGFAVVAVAVLVAVQATISSSNRLTVHRQADIPTVAPGVDVLAGIARCRCASAATTIGGMRSGTAGPTTTPHLAASTGATPATTSSTAISSTSPTCRSSDVPPPWPQAYFTIRIPTQRSPSCEASRPGRRCRSTTSCRWPLRGIWAPGSGRTTAAAVRQRPRESVGGRRRGQPGQGRQRTGDVDAAQRGISLSVRNAVHRSITGLRAPC